MPTYRTEIGGKTYQFEAANPEAAARAIDEANDQAGVAPIAAYTGEIFSGDPARAERAIAKTRGLEAGPAATAAIGTQAGTLRNFNDEVAGLSEASGLPVGVPPIISAPIGAARMGLEQLGFDQGRGQAYDVGRERVRGFYEGAQQANPATALASEVVGGFAGPVPAAGGTVLQNIGRGAAYAGTEGALSGFGAGEGGAGNRATGAAIGGGVGVTLGTALPIVQNVGGKLYRQAIPQAEEAVRETAERDVANVMRQDIERMTPEQRLAHQAEMRAAREAGQPIVLGDMAGEATRTLARTAGNQSDQARAVLRETTGERFADQGRRAATWWDEITDAPRGVQTRERLQDAAQMANRPAYRRAYAAGEGGIWDDILQGLTTSPAVRRAISDAEATGADRAAVQGFRAPRNPFVEAADGTLTLQPGMRPTLQFWDHVQRNLRSVADRAVRAGDNETADRIGQLRRTLNSHLDAAVPEFGEARRGAAGWFGADDALEAGENFLNLSLRGRAGDEARQGLARMNEAERGLFQQGVIEGVRKRFMALGDNQNINSLFNNPEMIERLNAGLGVDRTRRLLQYLGIERTMTQLRTAVSGGSNTMQQYLAAGGMGAGGMFLGDEPLEKTTYGGVGALVGTLLTRGNNRLNARVAEQVGNLLSSGNEADWRRVVTMMQRSPALRSAWGDVAEYAKRAAAQQAGAQFAPGGSP